MTDVAADPYLVRVTLTICTACLDGGGGECHTPGCAFWMSSAPDVPVGGYEIAADQPDREMLGFADVTLDVAEMTVRRGGRRDAIPLTPMERDLLACFLRHPRAVLGREQIYQEVWGYDYGVYSNRLDVCVSVLRRKLGEPPLIYTVFGVGYMLREP